MTKIKFIAFILFTTLITSCSSDNTSEEVQSATTNFSLTYNKEVQKITSWEAIKEGDILEVTGDADGGMGIDFKFNIYGNLYQAFTHPNTATSTIPYREASENFTSNTFTFTLVDLNTTAKTVNVKYSGKVYEDGYDHDSAFTTVSGEFSVTYTENPPQVQGLGTYAKVDGKDWHGISMSSSTINQTTTILNVENDGEYSIGIVYPESNLKVGTFAFTNNTSLNRISFQKFDLTTYEYVDYDVSGTITYTVVNNSYVSGTFSLTATNPVTKAKIVISDGTFTEMRSF